VVVLRLHALHLSADTNLCPSLRGVSCYGISAYVSQSVADAQRVLLQIANRAVVSCCDDCAVSSKCEHVIYLRIVCRYAFRERVLQR
jgi:hypothetical protein